MDQNRRTVCIREIQKSLDQSVKRLLELKIEALGVQDYFEVQQSCIKSHHGDGLIIFQGMQNHTADSIKSLEGYDCAWIEEAQTISHRSLTLLRPTIRKQGSEIWATWNPKNETDPIDVLMRSEHTPKDSIIRHVKWEDNPWFTQVMRDEMDSDKKLNPDEFGHVWGGEYLTRSRARVFSNWRVEEFETPRDAILKQGADWGYSSDPTCLVRGYIEGRKLYLDYEAYERGCEIEDLPGLFMEVPDSELYPMVADSSRPEVISYMRRNGYKKIRKSVKGPGSIEAGISWLKSYEIIVHPRCANVIDELGKYKYKIDPETDKITNVLEDKHNHCIDAIRYMCEGARRIEKKKQELLPVMGSKNFW